MSPWPSGVFQTEDSSSPTGIRNDIPDETLPLSLDDRRIDPNLVLNKRTGFNPASPIIAAFSTGVDGSNLVNYKNYPASVWYKRSFALMNEYAPGTTAS